MSQGPEGEPPGAAAEQSGADAPAVPALCRHCGEPLDPGGSAACARCGTVVAGAALATPGVVLGAIVGGIVIGIICALVALAADVVASPHAVAVYAVFFVTALLIGLCLVAGIRVLRGGRQALAFFLISTGAVAAIPSIAFGVLTLACANARWN